MLNKIFESQTIAYMTLDDWPGSMMGIDYHANVDPYIESITGVSSRLYGLFLQDTPTAVSLSRIYLIASENVSYWPSWELTVNQWDSTQGGFIGKLASNFGLLSISTLRGATQSSNKQLFWVFPYSLESFGIPNFYPPTSVLSSEKYGAIPWQFNMPLVDENNNRLLNVENLFNLSLYDYSAGTKLYSWRMPETIVATALEEFGRCWVLTESRVLVLLDYQKRQILGRVKTPPPAGGTTLVTQNKVRITWDTRVKRLLFFEIVSDNLDGSCNSKVIGFRNVPLATRLTLPVPLRWPREGRTIPVLVSMVGDLNEGVSGGIIQTTVTGDAQLVTQPITDISGNALAKVQCLSEGSFVVSCQAAVADSNVPVNQPDTDGGSGGGTNPVTPPFNPLPTASLVAVPSSGTSGTAVTLTWSTTNATTVLLDNGIGAVGSSGSQVVHPTATTTYKLTATGAGGTITKTVTVTIVTTDPVTPPPDSGGGTPIVVTSKHLWVSASGNDQTGDGTEANPFKTIQKAANVVTPDTTVHVKSGVFAESVLINRGGTSSGRVVFKSESKWGALLRSPSWYNFNVANGLGYVDFVDFACTSPGRDVVTHGIIIYGHHCRVIGNHIYGLLTSGVNKENTAIVLGVFTTAAATAGRQYNEAWNNLIHDIGNDQAPITSRTGQGIYVTAKNCHAYNNVIYNCYRSGLHVNHQCGSNNLVNNTIGKCPCPSMGALLIGGGGDGESLVVDYVSVVNNLVLDSAMGLQVYCGSGSSYGSHNLCSHNQAFGCSQPFASSQQFGTPISNQSFYTDDPSVVSRSSPNYDLQAGSAAKARGLASYAPDTDYTGATRPASPSIGAYE